MRKLSAIFITTLVLAAAGFMNSQLAGQSSSTALGAQTSSANSAEQPPEPTPVSTPDRVRTSRSRPGVLTREIRARGFGSWHTGSPVEMSKPVRIEADSIRGQLKPESAQMQIVNDANNQGEDWVKVKGLVVNVRSEPDVDSNRIGSFRRGTRLRVLEREQHWTHIESDQTGQTGWMYSDYLQDISDMASASAPSAGGAPKG